MLTNAAPAQAQEHPVQNPSQLAPEDLSAVQNRTAEGQNNVDEATLSSKSAPEAPAPEKDKELLSTQYAQLARREKALYAKAQARERAIAEREAAIQAREEAIKAKDSEYQAKYIPKDRLTQDTINVLLENGLSYDQITQMFLTQQTQDPATKLAIQRLEQQLRAQEEAREADRKAMQANQDAQYQQALKQIRSDASELISQDSRFEAIKATRSLGDVVELIEETFKQDGRVMSVEEACQEVEDHLVEKLSQYSQISKIQQRLRSTQAANASPKQSEQTSQQHQPKPTLTNAVSTSKKLTAKERAILAFNNQLKK
jgi:hypothetical protein